MANPHREPPFKNVPEVLEFLCLDIWGRIEVIKRGAYYTNRWSGNDGIIRTVPKSLFETLMKGKLLRLDGADRYHPRKTILAISAKGMAHLAENSKR